MTYINTEFLLHPFSLRSSKKKLGVTLAFGALIFGGTYGALAKGLTEYLSPISLLLASETLTALFVLITLGIIPIFKAVSKMDLPTFLMAALVGVLNSAIAPWLWFAGLSHTTAINASILSATDILFMLLLGSLMLSERISRMQGLGAFIVLAGALIIAIASNGQSIAIHVGDGLIFAATGVFSLGAVLFKKHLTHISPEVALIIRNLTGMFCVLAISLFLHHPFFAEIAAFPLRKVLLLIAFAFFARYIHLTFYYESIDRIPATTLSLILNAQPLAGVLFAMLILGESVHTYHILGAIFIIFGLILEQSSTDMWARLRHGALQFHLGHRH